MAVQANSLIRLDARIHGTNARRTQAVCAAFTVMTSVRTDALITQTNVAVNKKRACPLDKLDTKIINLDLL